MMIFMKVNQIYLKFRNHQQQGNLKKISPVKALLKVEKQSIYFEVDSGACVSCISKEWYKNMLSNLNLISSHSVLLSYTNE